MSATATRGGGAGRDAAIVLAAQVGGAVAAFGLAVVVARVLGPTGAGVLQLSQTLGNQLALVLSLGASISVVRAIALHPDDSRPFSSTLLLLAVLAPVFAVAAPLVAVLARHVVDDKAQRLALLLALPLGWLFIAQDMTVATFRGRNRYGLVAGITLGARVATAVAVVAVVAVVETSARAAVLAMVAVNVAVAAAVIGLGVRAFGVHRQGVPAILAGLLRFNLAGHVGTIVQEASYRLDLFLVAGMRSTAEAGVYGMAGVLSTLLWYLPNAIGTVVLSRAPGLPAADQRAAVVAAARVGLAVMLVMCAVAGVAAPFVVPALFGARFSGAVVPFLLLLPGVVLLSVWKVVANGMAALGHPALKLRSSALGAVTGLALDVWLIPAHGIKGAALAASVAYATTTIMFLPQAARLLDSPVARLLVPDFDGALHRLRSVTRRTRPPGDRAAH